MTHHIIYLAAPYTHSDLAVREARFEQVTRVAANLIAQGKIVFSPLTMTHPIDRILADRDTTLGSDYWVDFDEAFMEMCAQIFVLKLDGWQVSSGVRREIQYFERAGKSVTYLEPDGRIE
jgi:Domain of unknown function (DUF1937)